MQQAPTTPIDEPPAVGARQAHQSLGDQVQEKAPESKDRAQERAQQVAGWAKGKLRQQVDQRSLQAAERINQQAADLRAVSDSLRQQGKAGPADAVGRLAQYAEKVSGYLREKDANALLADAEDFGGRQPWAMAAIGLALGFAASRLLKASSTRRYSERVSPGDGCSSATPYPPPPSVSDPPQAPRRARVAVSRSGPAHAAAGRVIRRAKGAILSESS